MKAASSIEVRAVEPEELARFERLLKEGHYLGPAPPVGDFLRQSRRIHYGFLRERQSGAGVKATQRGGAMLRAALALLKERPSSLLPLAVLTALDTVARLLAHLDILLGRDRHIAWVPSATTKSRIEPTKQP